LRYTGDGREEIPYFKNQPWAKDYWREYHAAWDARPPAYRPYLIWRIRPFAGKTLNVDDMGLRVTPGAACTPGSYRVYTFGGSTMWGTGVPDWGTIPAILQSRMTQEYVRSICVVNYGEQGYASTQDTIQLLLLLQASYAPDLALFYDGINDVFAAYESGVPGSHQGARRVAAILENRRENTPLIDLISVTRTYKLWRRLALGERGKDVLAYQRSGVDTKTLTNGIVRSYLGNYEIIRALADAYGFRVQFFWQTSLFTDTKPLTEVESSIKRAADRAYPGLADLFRRVGAEVEEKSRRRPYIHHITDVFRNRPEQIFIDPFHVTIQGNELIVTAMQEFIHVE
jgi:lysophospholipase L1-like esterase